MDFSDVFEDLVITCIACYFKDKHLFETLTSGKINEPPIEQYRSILYLYSADIDTLASNKETKMDKQTEIIIKALQLSRTKNQEFLQKRIE